MLMEKGLSDKELALIDAYWRAANYLSVGQIYLYDNPLLKKPLTKEHIKPRLLGHWGTTPGLNFIYVHLNRLIKKHDLNMLYLTGPGHGGPGLVANAYLEGTYSEVYPNISQDEAGMKRLFTQFSFPGGIPSHVAPETPGSIHEGGELGYALSHAYGAAFDNPDLIVAAVVGGGEAASVAYARAPHAQGMDLPEGDRRQADGGLLAFPSGAHGRDAPEREPRVRPREVDEELQAGGAIRPDRAAHPRADRVGTQGGTPHERQSTCQRRLAAQGPAAARLPRLCRQGAEPRCRHGRIHPCDGDVPARRHEAEHGPAELPPLQSRREQLEPLAGRDGGHQPSLDGGSLPVRRPPGARRPRDGDAHRPPVPRVAGRVNLDRPDRIFLLRQGVHPHYRFHVQSARQVAEGVPPYFLAAAGRLAQLPALLARVAPGP